MMFFAKSYKVVSIKPSVPVFRDWCDVMNRKRRRGDPGAGAVNVEETSKAQKAITPADVEAHVFPSRGTTETVYRRSGLPPPYLLSFYLLRTCVPGIMDAAAILAGLQHLYLL